MKPMKIFLVNALLILSLPVVGVMASRMTAGAHQATRGTIGRSPLVRPPMTIWERMRDPRGWWQSRLVRSGQQNLHPQMRSNASGAQSSPEDIITSPIFFIPPTYDSAGKFARNAEVGDFNGDGKTDLLISNECVSDADCTQGTVAVLLGNGDGTYQPAVISNTGAVLASVTIGDFNRDGKLDVAVNNGCADVGCTGGSVNILLGNGNGTFQSPVAYPSGGNAFSVEAGDLNGDGKLDVVVVNGSNSAGVLLGNGDGTFKPVSTITTSASGESAVFLGDFNSDSKLDLAVVTSSCDATPTCTRSLDVLLGNGDGTFGLPVGTQSSLGVNSQAVGLGDVNGDGKLDVAIVDNCVPVTATCAGEVADVFVGNGDGTFKNAKSSAVSSTDITFVGVGDLTGDGKADLVTVDPDAASATVMAGAGDGSFQILNSYETEGSSPILGILGDLNGDGKTDLAVANACQLNFQSTCTGAVIVLLANGNGTLQGPPDYPVTVNSRIASLTTADFNGDGRPDLAEVLENVNSQSFPATSVNVLLGQVDGTFVPTASTAVGITVVGPLNTPLVAGDFNRDGKIDLATTACLDQGCTSSGPVVLLGQGDGTFRPPLRAAPLAVLALAVGDFNGDGRLDLASVTNTCTDPNDLVCNHGFVNILLGNGDGTFQLPVNYPFVGDGTTALTVGDFDLDGKLDLVTTNGNCGEFDCPMGSLSVFLGNGDGTFQPAVNYSSGDFGANSVAMGDLNGDGKVDLVVSNAGSCSPPCGISSIGTLLGKGDGSFQGATIFTSPSLVLSGTVRSIALADLDGDGKLDLAMSNRNVLLGNGDGTFQDPQNYNPGTNGGVSETVADFNGDGKLDLAVATDPFLAVLLNITAGRVQDFGIGATPLSPAAIAAGGSATSTITITKIGGFNENVSLSCSMISPSATLAPSCSFSPASVTNGSGTTTLTVSTTAPHSISGMLSSPWRPRGFEWLVAFGGALIGVFLLPSRQRRHVTRLAIVALVFFAAGMGCGGSGTGGGKTGGTPPGNYTIVVNAASTSPQLSHTTTVTLTLQ